MALIIQVIFSEVEYDRLQRHGPGFDSPRRAAESFIKKIY